MPTNAEMFETLHNWHIWNGADYGARVNDAEGRHASAEDLRAVRVNRTVDPWDEIGRAMNLRAGGVRNEYAAMVVWVATNRPDFVDLDRYRAAP